MNKGVIACAVASIVITGPLSNRVHQQNGAQQTSITGRISPATAAEVVRIVSGRDSVKAVVISGNFFVPVKPGRYKLIINTKARSRDVQLDNLVVKQNQALDIGEILLQ